MREFISVTRQMAQRLAELDAAGIAIVVLRCDRRGDIRAVVDAYIHKDEAAANINEVTSLGTLRRFGTRFEWRQHGLSDGEPDYEDSRSLMHYLESCTGARGARERKLLFIPNLVQLLGEDPKQRTPIQMQYLSLLEDIARIKEEQQSNVLIVAGCTDGRLLPELAEYTHVLDIPYPEKEEILSILLDACTKCAGPGHELEPDKANRLAEALRGFRESDIRRVIRMAYTTSPHPMRNMTKVLSIIYEEKRQRIDQVKGLHWIDSASPVGGMDELQDFLREKGEPMRNQHLAQIQCAEPPQALLLYGPPGCGKSLASDWAAKLLGGEEPLPLLHLSLTSLLEKWVGQSESNYAMAMQAVESIAPCVLVIEELEKLFGRVDKQSGSEVGGNLFSMFLQWMEKPKAKPILVMASANREEELPPESDRKGRFDEVFSVSIPTGDECLAIIQLHLEKYRAVLHETSIVDGKEVLTLDYLARFFVDEAARQKRFLTGADIKGICKMLFAGCFHLYCQNMTQQERQQAMTDSQPRKYETKLVLRLLREELAHTRTFLDSKMPVAADYWLKSYAMDARPASRQALIAHSDFDPKTGKISPGTEDLSNYDCALRAALAAAITARYGKRK